MNNTDLYNILEKLVSFETVAGEASAQRTCFDYVEGLLSDCGLQIERATSSDVPSLVANSRPGKHSKLILQAHLDVVPGSKALFTLRRQDGHLVGRGTYDMKFAAACYLQLAKELKDELDQYDFGIMFTSDEEIGGDSVKALLEQGYGADASLLPDGGDNWQIEASCNGVWIVKLVASGRAAHGSRPWEGDNAIDKLVTALGEVQDRFSHCEPHKCSLTVSQISGGVAFNQVPDQAEATLDMRFITDEHARERQAEIQTIADKHGLQLQVMGEVKAGTTDMDDPEIVTFMRIAERLHGQPVGQIHSLGASDAQHFAAHNIPCIVIRPLGGGHHSDHEWLDETEFQKFYDLIKAYVTEVAKI